MQGGEDLFLYALEAEQQVLGAILEEPTLIKDCPLKPDHLSPGRHRNLLYTMIDLDNKGLPIDLVSIAKRVMSKVEALGGVTYLTELQQSVPTLANFKYHCSVILEYYQKRRAVEIANTIKENVYEGEPMEVIQSGITDLMNVQDTNTDDEDGDITQGLINMYDRLENATGEITGIPSGYSDLDRMTSGFQTQDLVIVGARPSMGKTAFALNVATNAAHSVINTSGDLVAIFSLEMGEEQLLTRMAASLGNIDAIRMRSAALSFSGDDWNKLTEAMGILNNMDLKIFDRPGVNVNYIFSKVRKLKRNNPDRRILVIIDYLQLLSGSSKHNGNRQAEISEISRMLKGMARELDVCVIALSQLSRGVESRQDKRPMMSDLRESGQIEQDADVIGFLYRDDYYNKESDNQNIVEIILAKQRNGPVGNVELAFIKEYGKFVSLDHRYTGIV